MEQIKGGKIYVKPFNYLCGLACIGAGALCLLLGPGGNIYNLCAPFYFVAFGFMMIASDLNLHIIITNCNFLDKYAGRGLFNIFVGSQVLSEATGGTEMYDLLASIIAYCIMALGAYLIVLHCVESDTSINGIKQSIQKNAAKAMVSNAFK